MSKPTVQYKQHSSNYIVVGQCAAVVPVDHPKPRLNGQWCDTSTVLNLDPATGQFETRNTIYIIERKQDVQAIEAG